MKIIIKKETKTETELKNYLNKKFALSDFRPAVIALITDKEGNILLQRRGPKSRDEANLLADIGGAVEDKDKTFLDALNREIREEVGNSAQIEVDNFVGGVLKRKYDPRTKKEVNWLFLLYKCTYKGGELLKNERGKCLGYEFYKYENLPYLEMLETTRFFWDYYKKNYNKCYSYAMGIGKKISKLDKSRFNITEDDGDYEIIFDQANALEYEKFIVDNLDVGYWNEYLIEDKIIFHFKENENTIKKYILSSDNNEEILNMCRLYAEAEFPSVKQMFLDTPFYQDKLDGIIFYD